MYSTYLPPWHFPQPLIEILEKVPDYAEVFNEDPKEGYLVLIFATLLQHLDGIDYLVHPLCVF